jgi:2-haloacid dehalogenase
MSYPAVRAPLAMLAAVFVLSSATPQIARAAGATPRFKAVAFDYFVLFNPDSIVPAVERVFPGKGRELTNLWRTRQFEYSWLRSMTDRYADFLTVSEDALVYSAKAMKLTLTDDAKRQLLGAYMHLEPWPDTRATIDQLKASGIRVVTVSNFSPVMLRENADHAGLTGLFDILISTDANQSYKPDPRAYALAIDRLHLAKQDILFAAFGGWDAAGARSFGYPTIWINRFDQPAEELGVRPDRTSHDLSGLLQFVLKM